MKFRIKADPVGPLTILNELPMSSLAVLEGLNGIGKTLAIRLLQLCTGVMPYRLDSAAWQSLCEGLGEFQVSVSDLRDGNTIEWTGDSRNWPRDSPGDPQSEWFRRIAVDGEDSSLDGVQQVLGVYRIAGDEGLIETLAEDVDGYAETIRRWSRRTHGNGSLVAQLEALIGKAMDQLGTWTPAHLTQVQQAAEKEKSVLTTVRKTLNEALERKESLGRALVLRDQLESFRERLPNLQREAKLLDEEIATLQKKRTRLDAQLTKLVAREAVDQPKRDELKKARRTLEGNERHLSDVSKMVASTAHRLNVPATSKDVGAALTALDVEMDKLKIAQVEMDAAPTMRHVLDGVSSRLGEAEGKGLPDQVAYDDPETHSLLTVEQVRAGVVNRRTQLEGEPPPPEVRELARRIGEVANRRQGLNELAEGLKSARRYRRLVEENEERVERALTSISNVSTGNLREIEAQRREAEEQLIDFAAKRATLHDEMGGVDASTFSTLEKQLDNLERELELSGEELSDALERSDLDVEIAQEAVSQGKMVSGMADRELVKGESDIRRSWDSLTKGSNLEWLRTIMEVDGGSNPSLVVRSQILSQAREASERVLERLGRHRTQLAAVERALTGIARHLRGNDPQTLEYVPQLQTWLGEQFSTWFNNDILRKELFPGASGQVAVDVQTKEVSWTEMGTDAVRSRPLEAFSSGEQAFAYTRARLVMLDEERPSENRLIALDEFGAFIAHDRLTQLLKHLKERAQDYPYDQVVVILPLSHDYAHQSESVFGSEHEVLEDLAEQIKRRKYAVRELV